MIRAYKFGALPPKGWNHQAEQEILAQTTLWNQLVLIEADYQQKKAAIVAADPEVALLEGQIAASEKQRDVLDQERRNQRKAARKKIATPELDEQITQVRATLKELWPRLKAAKARSREQRQEPLRQIADERYNALADARRNSGLFWCNSNVVVASFDAALRRIGPGESLHPRSTTIAREGRLTNQIQMGEFKALAADDPQRKSGIRWATLLEKGHAQINLGDVTRYDGVTTGRNKHRRWRPFTMTVRSDGKRGVDYRRLECTWLVCIHRVVPDDAVIKMVTVTRSPKRSAPHRTNAGTLPPSAYEWHVVMVCEEPDPPRPAVRACAGIDLGWRMMPDGIRVATVVGDADVVEHITLPQFWVERREKQNQAQSELRTEFNNMLAELRAYPRGQLPSETADATIRLVTDEKSRIGHLIELVGLWQEHAPAHPLTNKLADWCKNDRAMRNNVGNTITRLNLRRREIYRIAAKWIAQHYSVVAIDRQGIKQMAEGEKLPPIVQRRRHWSAVHELGSEIERAVKATGGLLVDVEGKSTLICNRCGHENHPPESWRIALQWRCDSCRALWDQDENSARNLLRLAQGYNSPLTVVKKTDDERQKRARITRRKAPSTTPERSPVDAAT